MFADQNLKCQNCDASVLASDDLCEKCGAKLLHRRVLMGVPKPEVFTLTVEENSVDVEDARDKDDWQFPTIDESETTEREFAPTSEAQEELRWGGFFRRIIAFGIDLFVIALLTGVTAAMAYVGYKVGLAAHGQVISGDNAAALISLMTLGWAGLTTAYFVVFHGGGGKTLGKWIMGLRVVGEEQMPIGYRKAAIRWLATVGFAPIGVGFLWILWEGEKRGWHDIVARTWVIRE